MAEAEIKKLTKNVGNNGSRGTTFKKTNKRQRISGFK